MFAGIKKQNLKFYLVFFLVVVCVDIALYVAFIKDVEIAYTHFFYVPVILAAMWYRKKAMYAAVFLSSIYLFVSYYSLNVALPVTVSTGVVLIMVAYVVGIASERQAKAEDLIETSLREKELLLKEIRYRVKNNMQVINSLLSLQSKYITDKKALESFKETRGRVLAMALVHEELYSSGDLSKISVSHYIETMANQLFRVHNIDHEIVTIKTSVEDVVLGIDMAIPCGLIISELISNTLKHAFPDGRRGEIFIGLHQDKDSIIHLMVKDNGMGMPQDVNLDDPDTLGLLLVKILARQLDASVAVEREGGTTIKLDFKVKEQPDSMISPKV
jgi:two-component sensor histidine kinase